MSKTLLPRIPARLLALAGLLLSSFFLALGTHPAHAAFPGANGKIAFYRDSEGSTVGPQSRQGPGPSPRSSRGLSNGQQIYSINPDSTGETNLSNNAEEDESPNWSADGLKITFDDYMGESDDVFTMNGDGSGRTDLTNATDTYDEYAAWSPDRTKIAFAHTDGGINTGIWVMNADGSNRHELFPPTNIPAEGFVFQAFPNWSPDGTKIAYSVEREDETDGFVFTEQVYVGNADGSGTPQNVSNNDQVDDDPNWSPDETKLAFERSAPLTGQFTIWVMNADGSNQHQVTSPPSVDDESPAWSPDGTQIVYASDPFDTRGQLEPGPAIWVVGADGSNPHQVSSPPAGADDEQPDWQPVGAPVSSASLATCTAVGSAVVHVADPSRFVSALNVHYKVDGGAEQVAAADGSGNVTIALSNGAHTVEFWGGDAAGYQETAHHSASTKVDTANKCVPPAPKVGVAGVRRACVAKSFNIRVHISSATKPKSVRVYLGSHRIASTTKTSFTLHINVKKLRRHTRLRIVATDANGKVTTIRRTIARCAAPKPRHKAAPRFTG